MPDSSTTAADLRGLVRRFVDERDWQQFHSPKNVDPKSGLLSPPACYSLRIKMDTNLRLTLWDDFLLNLIDVELGANIERAARQIHRDHLAKRSVRVK